MTKKELEQMLIATNTRFDGKIFENFIKIPFQLQNFSVALHYNRKIKWPFHWQQTDLIQ